MNLNDKIIYRLVNFAHSALAL